MTEISTLTTDYLLAVLAAALGVLLLRQTQRLPSRLWAWALIGLSLAAFAGGTWHGFQEVIGERLLFWIWKGHVYLVAFFGFAAVCGSISALPPGRVRGVLLAAIIGITVVYCVFMLTHDDFIYVIYFSAGAMFVLLIVQLLSHFRIRDPASPWFLAGIVASSIGAMAQASGLVLHEYFNNNDLFHVIEMAGIWMFFRGARRLDEQRRD